MNINSDFKNELYKDFDSNPQMSTDAIQSDQIRTEIY
jgi:hypothetical protein